jgi:hypothetical protein
LRPGGREHVATDLPHIDRELADRLAGVEQVEDAVARGDAADLGRRIDEPALRGHVRDRDQLCVRTDRALERGEVDLARRVVVYHVAYTSGFCIESGSSAISAAAVSSAPIVVIRRSKSNRPVLLLRSEPPNQTAFIFFCCAAIIICSN